jgi:hypothetical protein
MSQVESAVGETEFLWVAGVDVATLTVRSLSSPGLAPETEERAQRLAAAFLEFYREDPLRELAEAREPFATDPALEFLPPLIPPAPATPKEETKTEFAAFDRASDRVALGVLGPRRHRLVLAEIRGGKGIAGALSRLRPLARSAEGAASY